MIAITVMWWLVGCGTVLALGLAVIMAVTCALAADEGDRQEVYEEEDEVDEAMQAANTYAEVVRALGDDSKLIVVVDLNDDPAKRFRELALTWGAGGGNG